MFSVLDISSNADNNEFNTCISTDTFPTSENQSRGIYLQMKHLALWNYLSVSVRNKLATNGS